MKILLAISFALFCATGIYAQESAAAPSVQPAPAVLNSNSVAATGAPNVRNQKKKPSPEEMAEMRRKMYERTGGFVPMPAQGPVVMYINAQKIFAREIVEKYVKELHGVTQFPNEIKDADAPDPMKAARDVVADTNAVAFAVVICDDENLPSLLFAPEERWGILNVAKLAGEKKPEGEPLNQRLQRQIWRVTTWTMGGGTSQIKSAMTPVYSSDELDGIGIATAPDQLNSVQMNGQTRGIQRQGMTTYRKAVELGIAPEPKDDVQKKIIEEVRAALAEKAESADSEKESAGK